MQPLHPVSPAGVVDALLPDGTVDFGHISLLPVRGHGSDARVAASHRNRVQDHLLPPELRQERLDRALTRRQDIAAGRIVAGAPLVGVPEGPLADALRSRVPPSWHCRHGAISPPEMHKQHLLRYAALKHVF